MFTLKPTWDLNEVVTIPRVVLLDAFLKARTEYVAAGQNLGDDDTKCWPEFERFLPYIFGEGACVD